MSENPTSPLPSSSSSESTTPSSTTQPITYRFYEGEHDITKIKALMDVHLSEPYSVYTYRYFMNDCPRQTVLAFDGDRFVGACVGNSGDHRGKSIRGYIAMLAVEKPYRKKGIASELVKRVIDEMRKANCDEVVLETELSNTSALSFYEKLGFMRDKRLHKYYLNQGSAFRLKLYLKKKQHDLN
ncbi:hypothetical protein FDP41_001764 [Naegleria fowleri]|uniref:N-acetyltransferase domain-containing protein n=1 Tax=Naegleria fowleri TaxID=5763 RepID=A0A6A5BY13_NAEFO|nr:uncharacterized protein FDP41_001764 [Naegleria fowleri]KAF0979421.1 hypothetical protein FDP41_001764 [Naegleria fowleri]CAG4713281.1 unnamed protein product [Naegleria fowleri]